MRFERLRKVICALTRHSDIEDYCFGYHHCARCGEQLGDSLAGVYKNEKLVGRECGCDKCRANYTRLRFIDKFLTPSPKWLKSESKP